MPTPFSSQTFILVDLYLYWNKEYAEFIRLNNVGVPLSYLVEEGYVILTDSGRKAVAETFVQFCELLGIDEHGNYESIVDMIDLSNEEE